MQRKSLFRMQVKVEPFAAEPSCKGFSWKIFRLRNVSVHLRFMLGKQAPDHQWRMSGFQCDSRLLCRLAYATMLCLTRKPKKSRTLRGNSLISWHRHSRTGIQEMFSPQCHALSDLVNVCMFHRYRYWAGGGWWGSFCTFWQLKENPKNSSRLWIDRCNRKSQKTNRFEKLTLKLESQLVLETFLTRKKKKKKNYYDK